MNTKIGFWGIEGKYGCFSNFYPCKFIFNFKEFNCSEQAFMWMKAIIFADNETAEKILTESDPKKIKKLGRQVKNFDEKIWSEVSYDIMKQINFAKYWYNEKLKNILVDTEDAYLFENSPFDYKWGVGGDGSGQNLLGKVLMEVRKQLQNIV